MFGFENEFDGYDEFIFVRCFTEDECFMINEVLDFHADCVEPGVADIVIKFENGFERLWFWKVLVNWFR